VKKRLYPSHDLNCTDSPIPLREEASPLTPSLNCCSRVFDISFTPLKANGDIDFKTIGPSHSLTNQVRIEHGSHRLLPLPSGSRYGVDVCRVCNTSQYMQRASRPCPNTFQCIQGTSRYVPITGMLNHRGSHLIKKYRVTLAHTLENQFLMNYTYVWDKISYLLFLKLLVIVNSSDHQETAFDLVKRRRMD
jgi:hypothetical protein